VAAGQVHEVNAVLRAFHQNEQPIPASLPPVVQVYLQATTHPPAWADLDRIRRTQDFFLDDGMPLLAVLSLGGMVGCYAVPHGARLLQQTHRLQYPYRRLAETGQFMTGLMEEHAFEAGGRFIPAVQKVRLIHAAVRHFLRQGSHPWDEARDGVPICQEDLLGALMLFSSQVVAALGRMGMPPTPKEAEDYYYVWRVTGAMLGIREEFIPATLADAHALNDLLKQRHIGPSAEGRELTAHLIRYYQYHVPGEIFDGIVPALIRCVVEDEIADMMAVPTTRWDGVARKVSFLGHALDEVEDHSAVARVILDRAGQMMLRAQVALFSGHRAHELTLPEDLRPLWADRPPATDPSG
jgi:hypothetical protein